MNFIGINHLVVVKHMFFQQIYRQTIGRFWKVLRIPKKNKIVSVVWPVVDNKFVVGSFGGGGVVGV